ncbi:MAG: fluoride efflux transporter CrcB [Candidatus Delongbacteria bacterium]|nr:fluoride efflux transporter CrcB [Candidatus Delongbacteria bacterium]
MIKTLWVALGGSMGAVARYGISLLMSRLGWEFPLATLLVNLGGCLIIGMVAGLVRQSVAVPPEFRLLLVTGFCGAFTTMSSFIYEFEALMRDGEVLSAVGYFCLTLIGCWVFFLIGYGGIKLLIK